jgi:hypothetical protein
MIENKINSPDDTALSLRKRLPFDYGTLKSDIPTTNVSELLPMEVADVRGGNTCGFYNEHSID